MMLLFPISVGSAGYTTPVSFRSSKPFERDLASWFCFAEIGEMLGKKMRFSQWLFMAWG